LPWFGPTRQPSDECVIDSEQHFIGWHFVQCSTAQALVELIEQTLEHRQCIGPTALSSMMIDLRDQPLA
jgi:hypothetical protein